MSISNINGRGKEVSLLNSGLFLKPQEPEQLSWLPVSHKNFMEEIGKGLSKLENMIAARVQKTIESFV